MRRSILFFLFTSIISTQAQNSLQILRGQILDASTQKPLTGSIISLAGNNNSYNFKTDSLGKFETLVALGKYSMLVQHDNFRAQVRENIMVLAGKQQIQDFELNEYKVELDSISIHAPRGDESINLDLWNIQRFAAVFYDPARMVNAHAGVVNTDDQGNNISVRGTTPNYVQWKIEGVEVVNPNHLENAGTINDRPTLNGGGVSLFSAQLLQNSEFHFAPFDATMGNASSGIFDMKLRTGNNQRTEHTVQASLLGTDISMEGPFSKKSATSYIFNYRYSTVGLLSLMGVNLGDEKINYQDFSYMITYPYKYGSIKLFGVLGNSSNIFKGKTDSTKVEFEKDLQNINYHSFTTINGVNFLTTLSNTSYLRTIISYSAKKVSRDSGPSDPEWLEDPVSEDVYEQQKVSTLNYISKRFSNRLHLKTGAYINYFINEVRSFVNPAAINGKIIDPIIEPFISLEGELIGNLEVKIGLHGLYQTRINYFALQPSYNIKYLISGSQDIAFNYGRQAQIQPSGISLSNEQNRDLKPTISNSFSLIHHLQIKNVSVKNEFYYQMYDHIPVDPLSGFSAFNYYNEQITFALDQSGTARVYGYDLSIEKNFKNFYIIASSSIYNSLYAVQAAYHIARFNTSYNCALTTGKEFKLKKENHFFSTDIRGLMRNGFREHNSSIVEDQYIYNETLPFYYRIDLRLSFRKNKKRSSVIWALDVQNVTNRQNVGYHYYDRFTKKVETRYQVGVIPVLSYKVLF